MELQPVAPAAEDAPARSPQHHRHQRKGGGTTRPWLVVGGAGESRVEEFGKHAIMKRTGLPARDLRILDPMLSYPSTVLGRERAIVVKLEQIKAIITAHEVLVLNPRDPLVVPFAQDVVTRVSGGTNDGAAKTPQKSETDTETVKNDVYSTLDPSKAGSPKGLPFEFKALEACLEYACRSLESEASTLEEEAYPALDALTSKISTLHLERVRQIKSRLVAISGRVQKVRDELENLLDDDMDMAEMYLTEKLNRHDVDEISIDEIDDDDIQPENERDEIFTNKGRESVENLSFAPDIEDLEMLLEAYFVQIEGTLNKLSTLREYVDDTEDYINIMLDDKQNQLLQMGVMLSTATLLTSAGIAVVGLFGMNIQIDLYASAIEKFKFWETTFGTIAGCLVLFVTTIVWGKRKGLLSW